MINTINKIQNINQGNNLGLFIEKNDKVSGNSFSDYLKDLIGSTNQLQKISADYSLKMASGEIDNIHEAKIAGQKAEISLQFLTEVRNKVLEAYREIMRMQI